MTIKVCECPMLTVQPDDPGVQEPAAANDLSPASGVIYGFLGGTFCWALVFLAWWWWK